ncbi:VWA domain-containing protein [Leucobacter luti]|uniref:von Willebrand factor type A domain-containing protein n=1 Tax=Leucobacter luti TaxID=340320 RepID=A0A4Q7TYI3_9MICO|nr:VWA domain-containing protein [Leucobacter luti]MBL3698877.1 VWA domain-containing protein [Leucobacter luti]RZT66256.1 von Willebrand factor type A domain-containing protein [Leucobacter luti]
MGYSGVAETRQRRAGSNGAGRRRGAAIAAVAAVAIGLLGATPALADQSAGVSDGAEAAAVDTPAPVSLRWRAIDAAGALQSGVSFEVSGPLNTADAVAGRAPITALLTDNAGEPDYVGLDLDPTPGAFEITSLVDAGDPARTHELAAGDAVQIRMTATAAGETPDAAAQTITVPGSTDDPIPQLTIPAAGETATSAPAAPESATPETAAPQEDPAPEAPSDAAGDPAPAARAAASAAEITPLALGPDGPGVVAPYVYWTTVDGNGALLPGATFELAGPRQNGNSWTRTVTVTDCVSAPCTGADRDPDPGEFQVKFLTPATNPTANGVSTNSVYRVRQIAAPAGYTLSDTAWRVTPSSGNGNTGNWGGTTYNFGAYTTAAIPPAKIVVKTGGDRTGTTGVTTLAGVELFLYTGTSAPSSTRPDGVSGVAAGWARCVSDANGECTFNVPATQSGGANRDARYWVVQRPEGAPAGWFTNTSLRTGDGSGAGDSTVYRFRTGTQLRSGQLYSSAQQFMYAPDSEDATASGGVWAQSRVNPTAPQGCGIDVALILDLSGSVGDSVTALRSASDTFVDSLVGTQSRMSLFSFSTSSPATLASQNYPALTSVSTQAQATSFKSRYAGWGSDGGTNWDRGLGVAATAAATNPYDIAVVITDGNPTYYGTGPSGPGNASRFIETENGIFSANALKQTGTRVIAFGVGAGATGANNALNLRAISGPTAGTDYFQTSNYSTVGSLLRQLALGACESQLTVTKMIVPNTAPAGSIAGAQPAVGGWEFTASNPGPGMTLPSTPVRATQNDGTGTITFPFSFAGGTTSAGVTVTETQQAGYTLQPVNGSNAVCTNLVTGAGVVPTGNPVNGFTVQVPNGQTVNCMVYNRAAPQTSTVTVDKTWRVLDGSGTAIGTYNIPGDEGSLPEGLTGQLTLTGPAAAGATNQDWGVVRPNYQAGGNLSINETTGIDQTLLPGCTLMSSALTQRGTTTLNETLPYATTLAPGPNTFTITNTVTCTTTLTLLKSVEDGTASPANWDLRANGGTTPQTFTVSGSNARSAGNTFAVTADHDYELSELPHDPAAPLAYLLDRVEFCVPNAATTGGCDWSRVDEAAPVSVGVGEHAVYRFVNRSAPALEVPLTGGLSSDALGIAGAGIAGLALLLGAVTWTRRRRHTEPSA